mmetsp:Transcript_24931/g.59430  ORF Transcript_24931/g.59430 Transcript_24931/m.59430 type:complete len:413 (-) Transcript_24931:367-1605(-)
MALRERLGHAEGEHPPRELHLSERREVVLGLRLPGGLLSLFDHLDDRTAAREAEVERVARRRTRQLGRAAPVSAEASERRIVEAFPVEGLAVLLALGERHLLHVFVLALDLLVLLRGLRSVLRRSRHRVHRVGGVRRRPLVEQLRAVERHLRSEVLRPGPHGEEGGVLHGEHARAVEEDVGVAELPRVPEEPGDDDAGLDDALLLLEARRVALVRLMHEELLDPSKRERQIRAECRPVAPPGRLRCVRGRGAFLGCQELCDPLLHLRAVLSRDDVPPLNRQPEGGVGEAEDALGGAPERLVERAPDALPRFREPAVRNLEEGLEFRLREVAREQHQDRQRLLYKVEGALGVQLAQQIFPVLEHAGEEGLLHEHEDQVLEVHVLDAQRVQLRRGLRHEVAGREREGEAACAKR